MNVPVTEKDNLSQYMISCPKKLCSIKISCDKFQISCLQCRHVDGDLRGLGDPMGILMENPSLNSLMYVICIGYIFSHLLFAVTSLLSF